MDFFPNTHKELGAYGERAACVYLKKHGLSIVARNVSWRIGEIDIIASKKGVLHIIEVKTVSCTDFLVNTNSILAFENLHIQKIKKVQRMAEWYVAKTRWGGEVQIDGVLVRARKPDGVVRISYLPQIL